MIKKVIYDREVGNYPTEVVDKNLTQNLADGTSDFRSYARNKFGFQQNDLTSFVLKEGVQAKNVLQFESEFKKELDSVLLGLKKDREKKMKLAKIS